jgi:hypothetical protein
VFQRGAASADSPGTTQEEACEAIVGLEDELIMVYTIRMLQSILSFDRPIGFPTTLPEIGRYRTGG